MNKTCLICTLGNRDIQFKKEYENELKNILGSIFDKYKDHDSNELILTKGNFLEYTEKVLENYDKVKDYLVLPIIKDVCLDYIKEQLNGTVEKIILVPTNQQNEKNVNPNHKAGDTFIEAKIIKRFLEENGFKGKVEIREARFDASNLNKWFNHFDSIIKKYYNQFDNLIFEISGGVPAIKEAGMLASLFREKIEVVEVKGGEIDNKNMNYFEKQIIKEKVKDLIKNYNYAGALSFKEYYVDDKKILNLLEHLNYRLNFDFDNALKSYNEERLEKLDNENNTIERLKYLILELLDNMEIELRNRNYANFLARVYRLEEAMGQYFILDYLKKNKYIIKYTYGKYNNTYCRAPDKVDISNLNKILSSYFNRVLYSHEPEEEELYNKLLNYNKNDRYARNNKFANNLDTNDYYSIVNKICPNKEESKIFNSIYKIYKLKDNSNTYKFRDNKNKNPKVRNLRNTTIVAHGFEGINKDKINTMLKNNGINKDIDNYFNAIKSEFLKIAIKDTNNGKEENIFDKLNSEIVKLL